MKKISIIAADIGAGGGRVILAYFDGKKILLNEVFRFNNNQIFLGNYLYWDFLSIFKNVLDGFFIVSKKNNGKKINSIGIDTWGADFGLINIYGDLIENPVTYRDKRTESISKYIYEIISHDELFRLTSASANNYCALFQLYYLYRFKNETSRMINKYLPIPNLINYFLTGEIITEPSILTGSQFFDVKEKIYLRSVLEKTGIPLKILPEITQPGKVIGKLKDSIKEHAGLLGDINISLVCGHDTASAVNGIPFEDDLNDSCFVIAGTWAVIGFETNKPLISQEIINSNFTNWATYKENIIFVKIFNCFYFIQEFKKNWDLEDGKIIDFDELYSNIGEVDLHNYPMVNLSSKRLFSTDKSMTDRIADYLKLTNQKIQNSREDMVKTLLLNVVLETKLAIEELEKFSSKKFKKVYIVGGGSKNRVFCSWVSDCLGKEVITGYAESTSCGNIILQLIALGEIKTLQEGREVIRNSFGLKIYSPNSNFKTDWCKLIEKYKNLKKIEEDVLK